MALIHQQLYQSDNLTDILIEKYIKDLVENIAQFNKNKKHANKLYKKLTEINNFVSPIYAKKYLTGFLEYRGLTFNEYLEN